MILGISGRKQAGKNTTANILHGMVLKEIGAVQDWNIGGNGELMIELANGWGEFDVSRKDQAFVQYAEYNMWPYVKLYSFADSLKWICTELFDIPYDCVWGINEQKNQVQEHLRWENMPGVISDSRFNSFLLDHKIDLQAKNIVYHEYGPMTAREFMQFLGTDIMRKMYEPIWVNACIKKIKREQSQLAIIADVRFPNEAKAIEDAGGTMLRLTRKIYSEDTHSSEIALDDYPFSIIIDNGDEGIDYLTAEIKQFYLNKVKPLYLN